jgi:predicted site-specific integrase-resolvase
MQKKKNVMARQLAKPPPITGSLISRAAMAQELDVCEHTLRIWERCGQGPPTVRLGRRVYYRDEAVHQWLLERERRISSNPV